MIENKIYNTQGSQAVLESVEYMFSVVSMKSVGSVMKGSVVVISNVDVVAGVVVVVVGVGV